MKEVMQTGEEGKSRLTVAKLVQSNYETREQQHR